MESWSARSGRTNPIIVAPLVYDGYIESGESNSFNLLRLSTGARLTGYSLTDDDTYEEGTYYLAFMIKVGDNTIAGDHVPVIMLDGTHTMDYQRIGVCVKANGGASSTAFTFGLTERDAFGPSHYTAKEYSFGTTYLLVLKYNMLTGQADLFINPKLTEGEPATSDATVTNNNLESIRSIVVRQRTNHSCILGGLRFAKTWMSAIAQQ